MKRPNVFINTKDYSLRGSPTTYSITVSDQFYYKHYYGRRATLSIGDVLPLQRILEGVVVCNVEHHIGEHGAFARASRDYAIVISRSLDNGVWTGGASRRRKAAMADGCPRWLPH